MNKNEILNKVLKVFNNEMDNNYYFNDFYLEIPINNDETIEIHIGIDEEISDDLKQEIEMRIDLYNKKDVTWLNLIDESITDGYGYMKIGTLDWTDEEMDDCDINLISRVSIERVIVKAIMIEIDKQKERQKRLHFVKIGETVSGGEMYELRED